MTERLYNAHGLPEPPSEIVRRLQQIDDRLGLRFFPIGPDGGGQWALTERWRADNPKREMIRRGEMEPEADFDLVGFIPLGVSADDAFGYVERNLKQRSTSPDDLQAMLSRVRHYNDGVSQSHMDGVKELGRELVDANKHVLLGNAKSVGGIDTDASGHIVGRPGKKLQKRGLTKREKEAQHLVSDR